MLETVKINSEIRSEIQDNDHLYRFDMHEVQLLSRKIVWLSVSIQFQFHQVHRTYRQSEDNSVFWPWLRKLSRPTQGIEGKFSIQFFHKNLEIFSRFVSQAWRSNQPFRNISQYVSHFFDLICKNLLVISLLESLEFGIFCHWSKQRVIY